MYSQLQSFLAKWVIVVPSVVILCCCNSANAELLTLEGNISLDFDAAYHLPRNARYALAEVSQLEREVTHSSEREDSPLSATITYRIDKVLCGERSLAGRVVQLKARSLKQGVFEALRESEGIPALHSPGVWLVASKDGECFCVDGYHETAHFPAYEAATEITSSLIPVDSYNDVLGFSRFLGRLSSINRKGRAASPVCLDALSGDNDLSSRWALKYLWSTSKTNLHRRERESIFPAEEVVSVSG